MRREGAECPKQGILCVLWNNQCFLYGKIISFRRSIEHYTKRPGEGCSPLRLVEMKGQ